MSKQLIRFFLSLAITAGIIVAILYRDQFDTAMLEQWINNAGASGPLLFILTYIVATIFFLPGSLLTLAGGALFGPLWGTVYSLSGATIGATIAFLLARYIASEWVEQKTGGLLKQIKNGVENEGWRFVAFVRLVPLFPFNLLNYALGLTRIKLSHYISATLICMIPGGFAYTYLGFAGRETIAGGEGLIQKILLAIALLATVAFLPRLITRLREKPMTNIIDFKQTLESNPDCLVLDVRSSDEYVGEQGHIAGAKNIPLEQLPQRVDELCDYEEKPIFAICRTDRRSSNAARMLIQKGYANVHVVKGGMTDWITQGYAIER